MKTSGPEEVQVRRYAAAGGVLINDGKVLLLERPVRGEVRLPKGHVEPGEAAAETALRETVEETGYDDIAIFADLGTMVVEFDYQGEHYVRDEHYFLMYLCSQRQTDRPAKDAAQFQVRWVPLGEAVERLTYVAEKKWMGRAISARLEEGG
jgi:8-oxo-dGTP pyrophosphatase MutT (NUDIX family)